MLFEVFLLFFLSPPPLLGPDPEPSTPKTIKERLDALETEARACGWRVRAEARLDDGKLCIQ
ncbi:MAG: hypothetical protein K8R77_04680 [Anaerolineaceae bacterium]|nr:hypothetical protein [Anaerolineaceae bacterium]